jgi:carboxymethylenebutenolidase
MVSLFEARMTAFDADLRSLAAQTTLSRRTVIATSLASGFALAVQPVAAQTTIATDTDGLTAGEVRIPTPDGEIPAYRAMPAEGGPFPTVLVIQEIFGVHEHIKDVCRRLAKLGTFALAPELYARQGDVSKLANIQQIVSEVVSKVPDAQVMSDLDAAVAFAKGTGKADTARLGITGFCWGGRITWLYAAHNPNVKAGVAWYGRLVGDASDLMPKHPVDVAADLKAPVLGLYGGADQGIPVATIDRMKEACRAAAKTCAFVVYPDAPHAFHADYRPSYRAEPAQDGWKRLQEWFRQHGVA